MNKEVEFTKKNLSTFFIENNNNNNQNISNKSYFKEEMPQYSPLKHIHNVNININNQININNNDIIAISGNKSSILIRKNIKIAKNLNKKSGKKTNKNIPNSKKILISRNKQNSLDFNSINSFLSGNTNYSNLKKSYLNKKTNPVNLLVASSSSNIKEVKKTTIYLNNLDKNKTKINKNNSNMNNYSSNIILLDKKKVKVNISNKKIIKPNNVIGNKTFVKIKNYKNVINQKSKNKKNNNDDKNVEKKIMKKSSTYQILPK